MRTVSFITCRALAAMLVLLGALPGLAPAQDVSALIAKLPPGKTVRITYDTTVDAAAPVPGTNPPPVAGVFSISQQGLVSADGTGTKVTDDPDIAGTNNPTLTSAGIGVSLNVMIDETIDPVLAGFGLPGNLRHQVKVINEGSSPASGVTLSIGAIAASGVSLDAVTPSAGTSFGGSAWTVGDLPVGTMKTLEFEFSVAGTAAGGLDAVSTNAVVSSYNEADPPPAGSSPANDAESTSIVSPSSMTLAPGAITLNGGTSRLEQTVIIANNNPLPVPGFLVKISNLPGNVTVFNATGMLGGTPFIARAQTIAAGGSFPLLVEFQRPGNDPNFTPVYTIELLSAAAAEDLVNGTPGGSALGMISVEPDDQGRFLVEWASTPGRTYFVRYSDDLESFTTVTPGITAAGTTAQFLDSGPPATNAAPATVPRRFYQVVEAD